MHNIRKYFLELREYEFCYNRTLDSSLTIAPNPNNKIQSLVELLYGRGGFGKSTLLKRFHEMPFEQDWHPKVSKIVDWEFAVQVPR